jgi:hypothetical protein
MIRSIILILFGCSLLFACNNNSDEPPAVRVLQLSSVQLGTQTLSVTDPGKNVNGLVDQPLVATFSSSLDQASAANAVRLIDGSDTLKIVISYLNENKTFSAKPDVSLINNHTYTLLLKKTLKGTDGSAFPGLSITFTTEQGSITILSLKIDSQDLLTTTTRVVNVPRTFIAQATFSGPVNPSTITSSNIRLLKTGGTSSSLSTSLSGDNTILTISSTQPLEELTKYTLNFSSDLKGSQQEQFASINKSFYTEADSTPDFPIISDEELLTKVQQQTFHYFWDFAHPVSGLARERNTSGDVVTSGGSGFGLMSIIVGIERRFITRQQGIERLTTIVDFLGTADRFHGAWPHWMNGSTGKVIPFSTKDDGGDLVETSFLMQGLLTFRQYLKADDPVESDLIAKINSLWESVEWDWYRKDNENVLYWHWSPDYNWDMNFPLYGYFEEQITYALAASSTTHSIPKTVYTNGYGKNGAIVKNNIYYGYKLPLETPGPLFWVQYSYLGLNPHFSDDYANYWEQNVNATLINYSYCVANPLNFVGYSDSCWGLTASDNQSGYDAHSPSNDLGVITPTAALSSFPYTPAESMKALKFFYYTLGDKLWGPYGFYDAFNLTEGWYATSTLAIDQGPIIVMIENYRSKLLWNLFMSAPEIQDGMIKLNFTKTE